MKKALHFANPVLALLAIALTLGASYPVNATRTDMPWDSAQNLNCPSLDEALVPVEHPVRTRLNQHFHTEGHSGEINNVVRVGNYGAAYLWNKDSRGRATSATPVAIEFDGDGFYQAAIAPSSVADVLESWGASGEVAQCSLQLLAESGI